MGEGAPRRERCLIDGCTRLEELASGRSAGGLCATHRHRKNHGLPMEAPINESRARTLTKMQVAFQAAIRLADVPAEDGVEYRRARDAAKKAWYRWAYGLVVRDLKRKGLLRKHTTIRAYKGARP